MKTIVMGKKVTNNYEVVVKRDEDNKFTERPYITVNDSIIEWEDICEYEGAPQREYTLFGGNKIYISEDECVVVTEQKFRADLGNWYQYTNKVLDVDENNKPECEYELTKLLKEYNKQMIEDDERAKAYCDLHKLDYEESDYDEIIKIIGKDENYKPIFDDSWAKSVFCLSAPPSSAIARITLSNDTVLSCD